MAIAIRCLQRSMNRILLSTIWPQTANTMYVFYDAIDADVITQLKKCEDEDPVAISGPSFTNSEKRSPSKTSKFGRRTQILHHIEAKQIA
jgi:hypothetical protein